jgi:hypothetical protein
MGASALPWIVIIRPLQTHTIEKVIMERFERSSLKLHRPIVTTVVVTMVPWLALAYLQDGFSIWPTSLSLLCWFALGAAYTHVFEYAYHRWFMHGGTRALRFIKKNHWTHHRVFHGEHFDSRDPRALAHVLGQWFLFPTAFLTHFLLLYPLLGAAELSSFLGGVVTHYSLFEVTHWFAHVADNDFDRIVRRVPLLGRMRQTQLRHHRIHHETPEVNFNFVPPFAMDLFEETFFVPGDCTETSTGPCFVPGTTRLRTPFDGGRGSKPRDVRPVAVSALTHRKS